MSDLDKTVDFRLAEDEEVFGGIKITILVIGVKMKSHF